MTMNIKVNDVVEFYLDNDFVPKTGIVIAMIEDLVKIRIEYGELHGKEVVIESCDIIDDSFDKYDTSDEKLYAWYDGE